MQRDRDSDKATNHTKRSRARERYSSSITHTTSMINRFSEPHLHDTPHCVAFTAQTNLDTLTNIHNTIKASITRTHKHSMRGALHTSFFFFLSLRDHAQMHGKHTVCEGHTDILVQHTPTPPHPHTPKTLWAAEVQSCALRVKLHTYARACHTRSHRHNVSLTQNKMCCGGSVLSVYDIVHKVSDINVGYAAVSNRPAYRPPLPWPVLAIVAVQCVSV